MEIRNRTSGNADRPRSAEGHDVIDFTRLNRERIADSVQELEQSHLERLSKPPEAARLAAAREKKGPGASEDEVAVSVASQALSADEDPTDVARRRAQIETVRTAVVEGSLATPDRVERAVRKLLGA